jgi:SAM-dependent methyltransferase
MGITNKLKFAAKGFLIKREIASRVGKVWVDIGCGDKKRMGCIGIDRRKTNSTDIIADISNIPLKTGVVDEAYATSVLEHFENPYLVIDEIHRILKPNGRLTAHVPNLGTYNAHLEAQAAEGHKFLADWQLWNFMLKGYFKKVRTKTSHVKYRSSPWAITRCILYAVQKILILFGFYDFARGFTFICRYKKEEPVKNYVLYWWTPKYYG